MVCLARLGARLAFGDEEGRKSATRVLGSPGRAAAVIPRSGRWIAGQRLVQTSSVRLPGQRAEHQPSAALAGGFPATTRRHCGAWRRAVKVGPSARATRAADAAPLDCPPPRANTRRSRGREGPARDTEREHLFDELVLSAVISPDVTLDVVPAVLPEAPGGIALRFELYDGPICFTLTAEEAGWLSEQRARQLTEGADPTGGA
jgi:hypothetical protein